MTAVKASARVNSYMLPHGNRCTDSAAADDRAQVQQPADDRERDANLAHRLADERIAIARAVSRRLGRNGVGRPVVRYRAADKSSHADVDRCCLDRAPRQVVAEGGVNRIAEEASE